MEKGNENVLRKEKEKATRPNGLEMAPSKNIQYVGKAWFHIYFNGFALVEIFVMDRNQFKGSLGGPRRPKKSSGLLI